MCGCSKGYVCPIHTTASRTKTKGPKGGMTVRAAVDALRGESIHIYSRPYFSRAFRTIQSFLTKTVNERCRIMSKLEVYEYVNGPSAPQNVYNAPKEQQNVKECLAEIQGGLDSRIITAETADVFRRYVQSAAIVPMTMYQFVSRYGGEAAQKAAPYYWTTWLEKKMNKR